MAGVIRQIPPDEFGCPGDAFLKRDVGARNHLTFYAEH
jgi:hypothetical protein